MKRQVNLGQNAKIEFLAVARETAKAIAVEGVGEKNGKNVDVLVWFPKSMLKDNTIPMWFVNKALYAAADFYSLSEPMAWLKSKATGRAMDVDEMEKMTN